MAIAAQQSITELDPLDRLLITALQTAPRADWHVIGAALDVNATTAARRWARLSEAGAAWLSCHPWMVEGAPLLNAFIELDCAPGQIHQVATELAEDPHTLSVEHVTGPPDLVVNAIFSDQAELGRYVGFRLGRLPGVTGCRVQISTHTHVEASQWRLDRLDAGRLARLAPPAKRPAVRAPSRTLRRRDLPFYLALGRDPRMPLARLAAETGLSPATARRRLDHIEAEQSLLFRCDVARYLSGWPTTAHLWCSAPPAVVGQVAADLAKLRETRLCAELTGPCNLLLMSWLRSPQALTELIARLGERYPQVLVERSTITLWPMKIGGHLLDPQGRHLRAVPLWNWSDSAAEEHERDLVRTLSRNGE